MLDSHYFFGFAFFPNMLCAFANPAMAKGLRAKSKRKCRTIAREKMEPMFSTRQDEREVRSSAYKSQGALRLTITATHARIRIFFPFLGPRPNPFLSLSFLLVSSFQFAATKERLRAQGKPVPSLVAARAQVANQLRRGEDQTAKLRASGQFFFSHPSLPKRGAVDAAEDPSKDKFKQAKQITHLLNPGGGLENPDVRKQVGDDEEEEEGDIAMEDDENEEEQGEGEGEDAADGKEDGDAMTADDASAAGKEELTAEESTEFGESNLFPYGVPRKVRLGKKKLMEMTDKQRAALESKKAASKTRRRGAK